MNATLFRFWRVELLFLVTEVSAVLMNLTKCLTVRGACYTRFVPLSLFSIAQSRSLQFLGAPCECGL